MAAMTLHEQLAQPSYWEPLQDNDRPDGAMDILDSYMSMGKAIDMYNQVLALQKSGVRTEDLDGIILPPRGRVVKTVVDMRRHSPSREEEEYKAVSPTEFDVLGRVMMEQNISLSEPAMSEVECEGQPMMVARAVLYIARSRLGSRVVEMSTWGSSNARGITAVAQPAELGVNYQTRMDGVLHDSKMVQAKLLHPLPDGETSKRRAAWLSPFPHHHTA